MQAFKLIEVREDFLMKVRRFGLDDQNQRVEVTEAKGGEPCRDGFRRAQPGEKIILASYCPFSQVNPYKEYGPIFIFAEAQPKPKFSIDSHGDYFQKGAPVVIRGYSKDQRIVDASLTELDDLRLNVERTFLQEDVLFVLIRFAAFGCYALRIDREEAFY